MSDNADLVRVGIVVKPHGISGELKVKPLTDFPSRFRDLSRVFMIPKNGGENVSTIIESVRTLNEIVLLKLESIQTIQEAQGVVGWEICITRGECVPLPPDSYYAFDLIGLQTYSSKGELVGTVVDVVSLPAQDLLVVKTNEKEAMIPLVNELVTEISIEKKRIVLQEIPGLFDLEQENQ